MRRLDLVIERAANAEALLAALDNVCEEYLPAPSAEPAFDHDHAFVDETIIKLSYPEDAGSLNGPQLAPPSDDSFNKIWGPDSFNLEDVPTISDPTGDTKQAGTREIPCELPALMDTFLASPSHGHLSSAPTTTRPGTGRVRVTNHQDQDETPAKRKK